MSAVFPVICCATSFRGEPVRFAEPGDAIRAGIGMVHQEILLVNEYTVWENVVLGQEPTGLFGRIDRKRAREIVREIGRAHV